MFRSLIGIKNSFLKNNIPLKAKYGTKVDVLISNETPNNTLENLALQKMYGWFNTNSILCTLDSNGIKIEKEYYDRNNDSISSIQEMAKNTTALVIISRNSGITGIEVEALNLKPLNAVKEALKKNNISADVKTIQLKPTLFASSENPKLVETIEKALSKNKNKEELYSKIRLTKE